MSTLKKIGKSVAKWTLIGAVGIGVGGTVFVKSGTPHTLVKQLIEQKVASSSPVEITIGSIEGNLISDVIIKDIVVNNSIDTSDISVSDEREASKNMVEIEKLHIKLNPFNWIMPTLSPLDVIRKINVENVTVNVVRDAQGHWNMAQAFSKNKDSTPIVAIPKATVAIHHLNVGYEDQKGWGDQALKDPFKESFSFEDGQVALNRFSDIGITLTPKKDSRNATKIGGVFSPGTGDYGLTVSSKLDLNRWGAYVLPIKGYALGQDSADIVATIRKKTPTPLGQLPFWYDIKIGTQKAELSLPFFKQKITNLKTDMRLVHGQIPKGVMLDILKKKGVSEVQATEAWDKWVSLGVISKEGELQRQLSADSAVEQHSEIGDILSLLNNSPTYFLFNKATGKLEGIPLNGTGYIRLDKPEIALSIYSKPYDIKQIRKIIEPLKDLKISGEGHSQLGLRGVLSSPTLNIMTIVPEATVYGFKPKNVVTTLQLQSSNLDVMVPYAELFKGVINGGGRIKLGDPIPSLNFNYRMTGLDIGEMTNLPTKNAEGTVDIEAKIDGDIQNVGVDVDVFPKHAVIFRNTLERSRAMATITPEGMDIKSIEVGINGKEQAIKARGTIANFKDANFKIIGDNIAIKDIDPSSNFTSMGMLAVQSEVQIQLPSHNQVWGADAIQATVSVQAKHIPFYRAIYDQAQANLRINGPWVHVQKLSAKNASTTIEIKGVFNKLMPQDANLKITKMPIETLPKLESLLPKILSPLKGILSTNIHLLKDKNGQKKSPFGPYQMDGEVVVEEGAINMQPFKKAQATIEWDGEKLTVKDAKISEKKSTLSGDVQWIPNQHTTINLKKDTRLNLDDFSIIAPIGISGIIEAYGDIVLGKNGALVASIVMNASHLKGEILALDHLKGAIEYTPNSLILKDVEITHKNTSVKADAELRLIETSQPPQVSLENLMYKVNLVFPNTDLDVLSGIINDAKYELLYALTQSKKAISEWDTTSKKEISSEKFALKDPQINAENIPLFGYPNSSVVYLNHIDATRLSTTTADNTKKWIDISGRANGYISLKSIPQNMPEITAGLGLTNFRVGGVKADEITLNIDNQKGNANYSLGFKKGSFGGGPYESIEFAGQLNKEGNFKVTQSDVILKNTSAKNIIEGTFPISAYWKPKKENLPIDLTLKLPKETINILTLLSSQVSQLDNDGTIQLSVSGTIDDPQLTIDELELKNTTLKMNDPKNKGMVYRVNVDSATSKANEVDLKKVTVQWPRYNDSKKTNTLQGGLNAKLTEFNLRKPDGITLELAMKAMPSKMMVAIADKFQGKIQLDQLEIAGPIHIPFTESKKIELQRKVATQKDRPKLTANVTISESDITIAVPKKDTPLSNWDLDITLNIGKEVIAQGGFLGKGLISGLANAIELELKESTTPLKISGTSLAPQIENKIQFRDGVISVLNRGFELLSPEQQRIFFPFEPTRIHENALSFKTTFNDGKSQLIPHLNLTAMTINEPLTINTGNILASENNPYSAILITFNGSVFNMENIRLDHFTMPERTLRSGGPVFQKQYMLFGDEGLSQTNSNSTSTYEVIQMIAPELAFDSAPDAIGSADQAQRAINMLGETQINTLFRRRLLRPVERQIAENVGLYDFRINYNFGRAVIGGDDARGQNDLDISLAQQLIDNKLFLRAKSNIDLGGQSQSRERNFLLSEVELQYFLLNQFSVGFANSQENNERVSRQKLSLKYSHEF